MEDMKQIDNAKIAEFKNLIVRAPVVALLGLPLAPFALHFYYYCDWSIHLWNSNEMLQYVAVALPAYATIALSYYTVLVNINLQEINEKLVQINEQSALCEAREQMPLVEVVKKNVVKDEAENIIPKIRVFYDQRVGLYRVSVWVTQSFAYAIKRVSIHAATFGLADNSCNNRIKLDERMKFIYEPNFSYVNGKTLFPKQETIFSLYFHAPDDFDDQVRSTFCVSITFENENNSGQKLKEIMTLSFKGNVGFDVPEYILCSEEILYDWC